MMMMMMMMTSKLSDDGAPLAPNNLLKPRAKEKHQLNPGGLTGLCPPPSNFILLIVPMRCGSNCFVFWSRFFVLF